MTTETITPYKKWELDSAFISANRDLVDARIDLALFDLADLKGRFTEISLPSGTWKRKGSKRFKAALRAAAQDALLQNKQLHVYAHCGVAYIVVPVTSSNRPDIATRLAALPHDSRLIVLAMAGCTITTTEQYQWLIQGDLDNLAERVGL